MVLVGPVRSDTKVQWNPAGHSCVIGRDGWNRRPWRRGASNMITMRHTAGKAAVVLSVAMLCADTSAAQSPTSSCQPARVIPLTGPEPVARIVVERPLPDPLALRGVVVIPYCAENLHIAAVFGPGALAV